jgi:predicted nucleic acid-binding protein
VLVLVSDSSVLIDLERGQLLEPVFSLPDRLVVPDYLYQKELKDYNGEQLCEMGLVVAELSPVSVERAENYRKISRALSLSDSFALSLAKEHGYLLLTGDQRLRALAEQETVDVHGLLWLLDRMEAEAVCTLDILDEGLQRITAHQRCRLPTREVNIRFARYRS